MKYKLKYEGARKAVERCGLDTIHPPEYITSLQSLAELATEVDELKNQIVLKMEIQIGNERNTTKRLQQLSSKRKIARLQLSRTFPNTTAEWPEEISNLVRDLQRKHLIACTLTKSTEEDFRSSYNQELWWMAERVLGNHEILTSIACTSRSLFNAVTEMRDHIPKRKLAASLYNYYVKSAYKVTPNNGLCVLVIPANRSRPTQSFANVDVALSYLKSKRDALDNVDLHPKGDYALHYSHAPSFNHDNHYDWLVRSVQFKGSRPFLKESAVCGRDLDPDLDPKAVLGARSSSRQRYASDNLKIELLMDIAVPNIAFNVQDSFLRPLENTQKSVENDVLSGKAPVFEITNIQSKEVGEIAKACESVAERYSENLNNVSGRLTNILRFDTIQHEVASGDAAEAVSIIQNEMDSLSSGVFLSNEHQAIYKLISNRLNRNQKYNLIELIFGIYSNTAEMTTIRQARALDMKDASGLSKEIVREVPPNSLDHTVLPSTTFAMELFKSENDPQSYGVLNQTFNGIGSLLARYSHLSGELSSNITEWIKTVAPSNNCLLVAANRDCDNSLARLDVNFPIYDWVTSTSSHTTNKLGTLDIEIDAKGSIRVYALGQEASVVPFSLRPLWTYDGPFRLFWRLFDPWIDRSMPSLDSTARFYGIVPTLGYKQRELTGRLVHQRAHYTMNSSDLKLAVSSVVQCQLTLISLLRDLGMGQKCFYICYFLKSGIPASKPAPLVLASAFSVSRFMDDLKASSHVSFVEMLPDPSLLSNEFKTEYYVSASWNRSDLVNRVDK